MVIVKEGMGLSREWWGGGLWCPPLLAILSHLGVAILCPLAEALGARLGEHPIVLGGAAVVVADGVASSCLGTCLKGTASEAVALGEVQQQGGTVGADHLGAVDQDLSHTLGVTHEGGEAGGGDDLEHGSRLVVGGSLSPRVLIIADRGWLSRVGSQFPKWHSVAVGDEPLAPASRDPLVLQLANVDRFQALAVGVQIPQAEVAAGVAVGPDLVSLVDGHGRVSVVDSGILAGQGSWQLPGRTLL